MALAQITMCTSRRLVAAALPAVLLLLPPAAAEATDWPALRGPNQDGKSAEQGLLRTWPEAGPALLWHRDLGNGFSGITAVGGRVFTLYSRGGRELAAAFDAATGDKLWAADLDQERKDRFGDGPRSTPLVDRGLLYAVSALGHLRALRAATGETVWARDLRAEFGARVPEWGVSASPIVEGDLLLFNVGGKAGHAVMAFHHQTGEVRWHAGTDIPGYSNPVSFTVGGIRQAVFFTGSSVLALDPASGRILWQQPWKTDYDVNAASPVFIAPDKLYVSSGFETGAALFRITAGGRAGDGAAGGIVAREMWRSRGMKNQFSSSIYHAGHLYGFDNKNFKCLDATTGEDVWRKGGLGHGSLLFADGHLIVLSEGGRLVLVEPTPSAYTERASFQVADAKHWTVPTLHDGRLYVRNERDLLCLDLRR